MNYRKTIFTASILFFACVITCNAQNPAKKTADQDGVYPFIDIPTVRLLSRIVVGGNTKIATVDVDGTRVLLKFGAPPVELKSSSVLHRFEIATNRKSTDAKKRGFPQLELNYFRRDKDTPWNGPHKVVVGSKR